MIEENVRKLLGEIPEKNAYGEKVTLVAAVKTQTPENINRAIAAGITDIGDNHAQEFRDNYPLICGNPKRHFIGRLQTNKIKYLLGRTYLYHSIDRFELAEQLNAKSLAANIVSDVLLEVNIGGESAKGGFEYGELPRAYAAVKAFDGLKIKGLMAMLPESDDEKKLRELALKMRAAYDGLNDGGFSFLSMGMSGDWRLCVDCGSNMIRLGTAIFGARNYNR